MGFGWVGWVGAEEVGEADVLPHAERDVDEECAGEGDCVGEGGVSLLCDCLGGVCDGVCGGVQGEDVAMGAREEEAGGVFEGCFGVRAQAVEDWFVV